MTLSVPTMCCFQIYVWWFCHRQAIKRLSKPHTVLFSFFFFFFFFFFLLLLFFLFFFIFFVLFCFLFVVCVCLFFVVFFFVFFLVFFFFFFFFFFSKSLFKAIGIVGEACLPSNAYFPWTPDYTPFILSTCLSVWAFLCEFGFMIFWNTIVVCWPQTHKYQM